MDLEYQSVEIAHNNATQISNVVTYILILYMHTFLPWPCQIMFETYTYHVEFHNLYMS